MAHLDEILTIIKEDPRIIELIGQGVYSEYTTDMVNDCIVYSAYIISNDKIKQRVSFKATIYSTSLARARTIEDALDDAVLTFADKPLCRHILKLEQNGGGLLYDEESSSYQLIKQYEYTATKS